MSSEEYAFRGLLNYVAPTDEEIQRDILRNMAGVIKDARSNPNALNAPVKVAPANAQRVEAVDGSRNGWREQQKTTLPPGQDIIEGLVNSLLPHGPNSKAK